MLYAQIAWMYLCYTGDHVLNETLNRAQARDVLAAALPYGQRNLLVLAALEQPDVHIDMANIFREGSSGASDGDETRLDLNFDTLGNVEFFGLEDVPHLWLKTR